MRKYGSGYAIGRTISNAETDGSEKSESHNFLYLKMRCNIFYLDK